MEEEVNNKIIVSVIVKEILDELSYDEKQTLTNWLAENQANRQTYARIRQSANYRSWTALLVNSELSADWEDEATLIPENKSEKRRPAILKYAAAVLLPLLLGFGVYYFINSEDIEKKPAAQLDSIELPEPGSSKAILVLGNGKSIELDTLETLSIEEADGTVIQKDQGTLNYARSAVSAISASLYNTVIVPRGGEYRLTLADGSRVFLNSMSQLRYPVRFSGDKREVELSGEAYFEVSKDASKTFYVATNGLQVAVVGTSFNVNAYENTGKVITTLVEGAVSIQPNKSAAAPQVLTPSQQAVYDVARRETEVVQVDVSQFTGWKDGKLIFQDARLEDVMLVLSRWYPFGVSYKTSAVKEIRISGHLDKRANVYEFLDIIEAVGSIEIEVEDDAIIVGQKSE